MPDPQSTQNPSDPQQQQVLLEDDGRWFRGFRDSLQPNTFKDGRTCAEGRKVSLLPPEAGVIRAKVLGQRNKAYEVELTPDGDAVESSCNCPAWNRHGPHCKHVVAAALVHLAQVRKAQRKAEAEEAAAYAEQEEAEAEAEQEAPPLPVEPSLPALAKLESWLGLPAQAPVELQYRLTPATHTQNGARKWLVDIRRVDGGSKGQVNAKRLLSAGAKLPPQDERVLQELARCHARHDGKLVLTEDELADMVELLRNRKVIYRGTRLLFSDEPASPQIHLTTVENGATASIEIDFPEGLGEDAKQLPLTETLLIAGRRTWAVGGQVLYPLEPELPPRLLRKWQLEPEMVFPDEQIDRVLTFFAAHLPRFELRLKADGVETQDDITPVFMMTLEGGADHVEARLAARYGKTTMPVSPVARHLSYATGAGPDGRVLYRRNEEAEREAGKLLVGLGLSHDPEREVYEATGDAAVTFWTEGVAELPKEWDRFGTKKSPIRMRKKIRPRVKVGMSGTDWFEVSASFDVDEQSLDLGAIRMWLDSGRKFIPLGDGSYAEADREELQRATSLLEEAGALPGKKVTRLPLHQAVAVDLLSELGETSEVEDKARKAIAELRDVEGIPVASIPEGLQAELRHYQEKGISWLWFLHRFALSGILADDMGLGKTLQALSLLLKARTEEGFKPSLVVAPTSVIANWQREAERFVPELKTLVWHGPDRSQKADQLPDADLILTSYALVRRDVEDLSKLALRYVVLDEAQNIKNADSATAQACKAIPSDRRLALTGTPLENRLGELWSIFDFLMPGFLGGMSTFAERYEQPIQANNDREVRDRLRRRIRPFVMRRLKTEVASDLPPKTESVAWCEMEPGQAALYKEVLEESRRKVYDTINKVGFKRSRVSILAALMRLRQVCCDPRLLKLPPGTLLPPSSKLERFGELMRDLTNEGHRALVFSQFTEMLELLRQQAEAEDIGHLYLDGRTRDRMARVDKFNDEAGPPLFFISLKAGGTGLNLTAADYVIHYDPWWNPAVEDQATDRAHRIGQTKAVISYKLITRGTVEEKILELQRRKRELAAGMLEDDGGIERGLSEDDIETLFRDDI